MLAATNICAGYGRIPILSGISLQIDAGEYVGLWGHNGMGKSTLMRVLMGYLPATGGEILYCGQQIADWETSRRARRGIGYVPQGRQIFSTLTVAENLRMGCVSNPEPADAVIESILAEFPRLKPLLSRAGGLLSGGEQQLLALARCLCGRPRIILLDEPTEGIQPSILEEMVDTLLHLKDVKQLTMILVEQNREFIAALAQRVLVMQKGAIIRQMTSTQLLEQDIFH
jgi:branched-chain amino acid transport system ATP-binding protein